MALKLNTPWWCQSALFKARELHITRSGIHPLALGHHNVLFPPTHNISFPENVYGSVACCLYAFYF